MFNCSISQLEKHISPRSNERSGMKSITPSKPFSCLVIFLSHTKNCSPTPLLRSVLGIFIFNVPNLTFLGLGPLLIKSEPDSALVVEFTVIANRIAG
jgi:hypothetical protein